MELDVVFRNKEHQKLVGVLSYPDGNEHCPGVVLCHGFTSNKELHFFPDLAEALVTAGIATLRFDCRACGKSEGDTHPTYKTMQEDFSTAIAFLKTQPRITKIGIAGHSMGGTCAILLAANDPSISAVVTFGAVANVAQGVEKKRSLFEHHPDGTYTFHVPKLERTFTLTDAWFSDAKDVQPLQTISYLKAPVLIIHGVADEHVLLDEAKQLFLAAKLPKIIKMIEGANHFFKGHYGPLIESTITFFEKWLQNKE